MKKIGTNSFFIPEVYDIIRWIGEVTEEFDVKFLPEVHSHYSLQLDIATKSDYVYDFALPVLVLHALYFGNSQRLKKWIEIRPSNQFTTLDTHDGIGTIDVEGILMDDEREKIIETLYQNGGNATLRASGGNSDNLDIYQINCTYYSALKCNDKAYVAARAIQFFIPGIPQVYYVGLFAGMNDSDLVEKTNVGRDINRHFYSIEEIKVQMERNVVKNIFSLMKFRNEYLAFDGKFEMSETPDNIMLMSWKKDDYECNLDIDLQTYDLKISYKEKVGDIFQWKELELIEMENISFESGKRMVPDNDLSSNPQVDKIENTED
jgi:sucrose phosphorylase